MSRRPYRSSPPAPGRRTAPRALTALLIAAATLLAQGLAQDVPEDPDAVLERIFDNMRGGGQHATLSLTVERPERTREYVLEIVSDGGERALTRVIEPSREADQAFLTLENELFVYNPRLGRVLRLPPSGRSDAFLGSDLSYSDLAGDAVRDDYEAEVASRTEDEIVLELTPRPNAPTPYGALRFRASVPELAPRELVYLDQRGDAVKRLRFEDLERLDDDRLFPRRMVVEDLTEDGARTVASWREADFGFDPPERCFTQEALERGCL